MLTNIVAWLEAPTSSAVAEDGSTGNSCPAIPATAELAGASNQATMLVSTAGTPAHTASPPGPSPDDLVRGLHLQHSGDGLERRSYNEWCVSARARCCYAFSRSLWVARLPSAFRPHLPPRYNVGTPPLIFLREYERSMLAAGGGV